MNLEILHARRREPTLAGLSAPAHPEYPIEQSFRSDDPVTQRQLMQEAAQGTPESDRTLIVAYRNGLRVLARSEPPLTRVEEALRRRFGATLVVEPPAVRYVDRVPVLEPYMVVLVNAPARHLAAVRKDLAGRRGRITRVIERGSFVLEAEAPLAALVGYHEHMRTMLGDQWSESHVATWLSRYAAVDGDGPAAA